jgi:benzoate membrane transport protein
MTSQPSFTSETRSNSIPLEPIGAALPAIIFVLAVITLPLTAAQAFGLSDRQTTSLIIALYGIPGVLCLVLARVYRQPLLMAWHTHGLVFLTALSIQYSYREVLGSMIVAGILVFLLGALGLSTRMAALIPAPIIFGIVAGVVMPFVVGVFTEMNLYPLLVGGAVCAYILGRRLLPVRVPPILPALIVGGTLALLTGEIGRFPDHWSLPVPVLTLPLFSWQAIMSIAPVIAIFIAVQSNLTTTIYLRSQKYHPPDRLINVLSGGGTALGAILGAAPISAGSAAIPLVAGPGAGEPQSRYLSVYLCGVIWIVVAIGASAVTILPTIIPLSLLFALAGIAMIGVLAQALDEIARGPLRVGPLFAFVVASSQLTLFGLGPLFWALLVGLAVALLLEKDAYTELRARD